MVLEDTMALEELEELEVTVGLENTMALEVL